MGAYEDFIFKKLIAKSHSGNQVIDGQQFSKKKKKITLFHKHWKYLGRFIVLFFSLALSTKLGNFGMNKFSNITDYHKKKKT